MLQLLGTFLPLYGIGLTVIAFVFTKPEKWKAVVLVVGPLLTLVVCYYLADPIFENGNMLAAVVFTVYFVSLYLYYPALIVVWIIRRRKKSKQESASA